MVIAIKEGKVTITAKSANGLTSDCVITVNKQIIAVEQIILDCNTLTLTVDESHSFTPSILPGNADNPYITLVSSNEAVVVVSGFKITAVGSGSATITATANDGCGASVICTVTVLSSAPAPAPVTVPLPATGVMTGSNTGEGITFLTSKGDGSYYVKFEKLTGTDLNEAGQIELTAFINDGQTLTVYLPVGNYKLKYATGMSWYGEEELFGPDGGLCCGRYCC